MLTFYYRWKIPREEWENFRKDWGDLTKVAMGERGATNVTLYQSENGSFVAIAHWPSVEQWSVWRDTLAQHPLRVKYRQYRVEGPEVLFPLVTPTLESAS